MKNINIATYQKKNLENPVQPIIRILHNDVASNYDQQN